MGRSNTPANRSTLFSPPCFEEDDDESSESLGSRSPARSESSASLTSELAEEVTKKATLQNRLEYFQRFRSSDVASGSHHYYRPSSSSHQQQHRQHRGKSLWSRSRRLL
jgi:hypothetical protein